MDNIIDNKIINNISKLIKKDQALYNFAISTFIYQQLKHDLNKSELNQITQFIVMGYMIIDSLPKNKFQNIINNIRDYSFLTSILPQNIQQKLPEFLMKNPLSNFWIWWLFGTKAGRDKMNKLSKKPLYLLGFIFAISITQTQGIDKTIIDSLFNILGFTNPNLLCSQLSYIGTISKILIEQSYDKGGIQKYIKNNLKLINKNISYFNNYFTKFSQESMCVVLGGRKIYRGKRGGVYYIKNNKKIYIK